jgi:hypothetical protein
MNNNISNGFAKNTIIDLTIFWGKWEHAEDLQNRWVFEDIKTKEIDLGYDVEPSKTNAIIVTISETEKVINAIIDINKNAEIINCAWIMSTTPEYLRWKDNITNIHYMFWQLAQKWLKLVYNWSETEIVNMILSNSRKLWIDTIQAGIEEHDNSVAITQALSHMYILLSWINGQNYLTENWKTPDSTIADMILENSVFMKNFARILQWLQIWDNLSEVFIDSVNKLTSDEKEIFSTPNFIRVDGFSKRENVIVDENMLEAVKSLDSKKILLDNIKKVKI